MTDTTEPNFEPLTYLQQVQLMLMETENEINRASILERIYTRLSLKNNLQMTKLLAVTQSKLRAYKDTKLQLEQIYEDEFAKAEKKSDN